MKKIKVYVFCRDRLVEWEIGDLSNVSIDFILNRNITSFKNDYKITFNLQDGFYNISSCEDFEINYKGNVIDSKSIEDGDVLLFDFRGERYKVVIFIQFENISSFRFFKCDIRNVSQVKIGSSEYCDIVYHNQNVLDYHIILNFENNKCEAVSNGAGSYVNGIKFVNSRIVFGDVIFLYGFKCVYLGDYIAVNSPNDNVETKLNFSDDNIELLDKLTNTYFRKDALKDSFSYINLEEVKHISIDPPIFKKYGFFHTLFLNKISYKKNADRYNVYLDEKFKEITLFKENMVRALFHRYPKTIDCYNKVINLESGLWMRDANHNDFLNLTIGHGATYVNNLEVLSDKKSDLNLEDPIFKRYGEIIDDHKKIKKAPIMIPLNSINKLCVLGNMDKLYDVVKSFIVQMTSLSSYEDLKLCLIASDNQKDAISYVKEIPHVYSNSGDFRYLSTDERECVEVIYRIKRIIKEREEVLKNNENTSFNVGYVVLIFYTDNSLVDSFLDYIRGVDRRVNVSFILLSIDGKSVPDYFKYILQVNEENQILYKKMVDGVKSIEVQNSYTEDINLIDIDRFVHTLSRIKIGSCEEQNIRMDKYTLHNLYGVSKLDDLDILQIWERNKFLSISHTPIGFKENNEILYLNIHKKHDGISGLILGESGTDKTEFLKSFILNHSINFNPSILNFVILKSMKDSSLNNLIRLPHVLDVLDKDNLSEKYRVVDIIKNEINKRRGIFASNGVSDIDSYLSLREKYSDLDEMPHLVMVIDDLTDSDVDFIEDIIKLKPSMMDVGMHLILSSCYPKIFVYNDSIKDKLDFKICFRLSDDGDVYRIIGDYDIYNNVDPEVFNFISQGGTPCINNRVIYLNALCSQYYGIDVVDNCGFVRNKVLRPIGNENFKTVEDVIINKILDVCGEKYLEKISVFNSSMGYLTLNDLDGYSSNFNGFMWNTSNSEFSSIIGIIDDAPYHVQRFLSVDFKKNGNLFVLGSHGSGKSTLIKTLVYSLCCEYKESHLNIYMVDKDTRDIDHFSYAPHVKGIAYSSDQVNSLFKKIFEEFELRKKIFDNLDISSIEQYRLRVLDEMPYILITIDSLKDISKDISDCYGLLKILSKYGKDYGIFLCIASGEYGDKEEMLIDYFGNKLCLRLEDTSIYEKVFGEAHEIDKKYRGRGVLNYSDSNGSRILEFQIALQIYGQNEVDVNNKLRHLFIKMNEINSKIYGNSVMDSLEGEIDDIYDCCLFDSNDMSIEDLLNDFKDVKSIGIFSNVAGNKEVLEKIYKELVKKGINLYYLKNSELEDSEEFNLLEWVESISEFMEDESHESCVLIEDLDFYISNISKEDICSLNHKIENMKNVRFIFSVSKDINYDFTLNLLNQCDINISFDEGGMYFMYEDNKYRFVID